MPTNVLRTWDTGLSKTDRVPSPVEFTIESARAATRRALRIQGGGCSLHRESRARGRAESGALHLPGVVKCGWGVTYTAERYEADR